MKSLIAAVFVTSLLSSAPAGADTTLLLCEPFGPLARFSPTGHVAIYLDRVCADSPTQLRRCLPSETGVVISRYKRVADADWIAVPLLPYLYAVEHAADVPAVADQEAVAALRHAYRVTKLQTLVPDAPGGGAPAGNWQQLVGAAYDRRIFAFTVRTTVAQDDALIRALNERPNRARFNSLTRNCADFTRDILNLYFPKAIGSSAIADLGLTTPKHVAKSLVQYAERCPELQLRVFVVAQVPGDRSRSGAPRGVLESLVRKPLYLIPLVVVEPWIPAALATGYVVAGRFNPTRHADGVYGPVEVEVWASPFSADGGPSHFSHTPPEDGTGLPYTPLR